MSTLNRQMASLLEEIVLPKAAIQATASHFAKRRLQSDETQMQLCVKVNSTVLTFLEAAKAPNQSMPEFMRECALTVSLQKLQNSQK